MKGKWSECPAFAVGGKYTLTVRNTSDARLESGSGGKRIKLDYLSSAGLPTTQPKSEALTQTQAKDALATAKVHITSSPTGGEIFVDGKFFGNTPSDITLTVGEHVLKVTVGGREWSRPVQITAGEITVHADLANEK
jgi:hypothetical protein